MEPAWHKSACILCENNCGIEIQIGGDDSRQFLKVRGDKDHPASRGYLCQKASRLPYYQRGRDRVTAPQKRNADGSFSTVSWDTAISEIAAKLAAIRDSHGGDKIFYYGGGGQGNHLPAGYAMSTLAALGSRYRSNALAQEKTGELLVASQMFGASARNGDFEHCQVGVFIGKNPWQSHGVPRSRLTVRAIARNPERTLVVFDPCLSETAELADIHVRVKPGTDAWALAALLGVIAQQGWQHQHWIDLHTAGMDQVMPLLLQVPVSDYCAHAGVPEQQLFELAQCMVEADSVAFAEDLGVQMNRHSTLVSYLNRLLWLLTGNFGKRGSQYIPRPLRSLLNASTDRGRRSPVTGAEIIGGLMPCNVIADEILTGHPDRFRAMIIEAANPVHSLADSRRFAEAMESLECTVVIDVAMSETARHADYVLPVANQYEKAEATFFNFEMPANYFHLRPAIVEPPAGSDVLTEAEIHCRLVEALGAMPPELNDLAAALQQQGRAAFATTFLGAMQRNPALMKLGAVVLHRILGPQLPAGYQNAAALWPVAQLFALQYPDSVRRAGIEGDGMALGENLFQAMLDHPQGLVFAVDDYDSSWQSVNTEEHRIQAVMPELLTQLTQLQLGPQALVSEEFPFLLAAGERRSYTANTIYRDPAWRRQDFAGALRISPGDAHSLGLEHGGLVRIRSSRATAQAVVEISERMQPGHVSLPNGTGLDGSAGGPRVGVAVNELTDTAHRDAIAGTPWHKVVPVALQRVS